MFSEGSDCFGRGIWENTGKMMINFAEPAKEIGPLKLTKKRASERPSRTAVHEVR